MRVERSGRGGESFGAPWGGGGGGGGGGADLVHHGRGGGNLVHHWGGEAPCMGGGGGFGAPWSTVGLLGELELVAEGNFIPKACLYRQARSIFKVDRQLRNTP